MSKRVYHTTDPLNPTRTVCGRKKVSYAVDNYTYAIASAVAVSMKSSTKIVICKNCMKKIDDDRNNYLISCKWVDE